MNWSCIKAWLIKTFVGTVTVSFGYSSQGGAHPRIIIPLSYAYKDGVLDRVALFQQLYEISEVKYHRWHVEESDIDYIIDQIDLLVKEGSFNIDTLKLVLGDTELSRFVYVTDTFIDFDKDTEGTPIRILSYDTRQKEADMQAQPPKEDLLFELNQFPPEGRFHLNQFLLILSNARLAGTWQVSDQVALATFRELSAKEDLINHMTDNFDVTLSLTHEVREGHEAAGWDLRSAPNLLTRNGYYTPRTSSRSRHEWNNLEHPANGFARAPQHEYSRLPYSGLTNEALVDLLNHYSLTQTLRFRPETNAAQLPAGLLLLDLVCERLMTQATPPQMAYPSHMNYTPHHFRNASFNEMARGGGLNTPPGSHWNFSYAQQQPRSQSPMTVSGFKSTPNLMEMMVHVNRTVNAICGPGSLESARISQEIHSAFKALGDGNWPTDQNLYLLVGGLSYANNAVQAMIDPNFYSGWVILDEASVIEPTFCLYNHVPKSSHGGMSIPVINFKFAVGGTLSDTIGNIADQMSTHAHIPDNARTDLLAQVVRVLTSKPIDSKEHTVLNFSMAPRSMFTEGLLRAMESSCYGCWIIYTDKTISDDPNDLPERFWFLGQHQDLGGGLW